MVCHKIGEALNLDSSAKVSTRKEIQIQPKSNHLIKTQRVFVENYLTIFIFSYQEKEARIERICSNERSIFTFRIVYSFRSSSLLTIWRKTAAFDCF